MAAVAPNFAILLDLAKETSSEKRRELLRQVTDVFLADGGARSEKEAAVFDEIVGHVAADLETAVRVELARKVAASQAPLGRTARRLALDVIEVARPVIEHSAALTETDILDVIHLKGQDHMMAVTRRPDIGENVSSALVERGGDNVVVSLLQNQTARMNRETFERVADRAEANPVLHAPFVRNRHVPLDLLNSVYVKVEKDLRREIMRKFHGVSPAELESALESSRNRLSSAYGVLPDDFEQARTRINDLEKRGGLKPPVLVQLLRENQKTGFVLAFCKLVEMEFDTVNRLVESKDLDALAMLCRGAGFDRALFVTIALLVAGAEYGMSKAEAFGKLYEEVPVSAAQRALRFWKVRSKGTGVAAAA
jgi:uncharacterized protein (DUF2336 family)